MGKFKVLITNPEVPEVALKLLGEKCELIINKEEPYPTRQQILAKCPNVDAIFWVSKERLDEEVLDAAGTLYKLLSRGNLNKMCKFKVLITNPEIVSVVALSLLGKKCKLVMNPAYPTRQQILANSRGVDAIFWASKTKFDGEVLESAGPQMKVAACMSAGLDNVDVETLKSRGIKLGYTPVVLNDAVADTAVLLILAASRRLHEGRLAIEEGTWRFGVQWLLGRDVSGSTVGIVGLGNIGQTIVKRLKPFDVSQFLYSGHKESDAGKELNCKFVTFDELLSQSDFVVCSCPLNDETRGMFNDNAFSKMKNTAIFVNIARGPIVDQDALRKALENRKIFAAGLDVMTPEPLPKAHPLTRLPNCVLLPHVGSATVNTRNAMAELTAQNILMGLGGHPMFTPVY